MDNPSLDEARTSHRRVNQYVPDRLVFPPGLVYAATSQPFYLYTMWLSTVSIVELLIARAAKETKYDQADAIRMALTHS
jgi:hypothetical protein